MKLQFKVQQYQTEAVDAVVDVFTGQPYADGVKYRIDPGKDAALMLLEDAGLRNAAIATPGERPPGAAGAWADAVEGS